MTVRRTSSCFAGSWLAGLILSLGVAYPVAAQNACPPPSNAPSVSLRVKPGTVVVNNGHSRQGLQSQRASQAAPRLAKGWAPVGLTATETEFSMNLRVNAIPDGRGRYCGYLDTVNATVGYDRLTVYIARRYRPGSCQYNSIMEHEILHVLVFRRALERYAPRLERRLETLAARQRPILAASPKQVAALYKERLFRDIQPLIKEMHRQQDSSNAKLDTPENYKREQTRCAEW
jgi:hypothetical protein